MYKTWRVVLSVLAILGTHDSLASRDDVGKDNAAVTMLILGTSLTANYQWHHELAKQLSQCLVRKVKIEILAVAGANSNQAEKQFSSRRNRRSDIVLVEFATNDADLLDGVGLENSRRNHKELLARIREVSPHSLVVLMTMNPAFGLRGWVRPGLADYNEMYRELTGSYSVELVDLVPAWSEFLTGTNWKEQIPDGLHPTEFAIRRIVLPAVRGKIVGLFRISPQKECGSSY